MSDRLSTAVLFSALGAMDPILWVPRLLVPGSIALPLEMLLEVTLRLSMPLVHLLLHRRNTLVLLLRVQYGLGSLLWVWL